MKASLFWKDEKQRKVLYVELASHDGDGHWNPLGAFRYFDIQDVRKCLDEADKCVQRHIRGE